MWYAHPCARAKTLFYVSTAGDQIDEPINNLYKHSTHPHRDLIDPVDILRHVTIFSEAKAGVHNDQSTVNFRHNVTDRTSTNYVISVFMFYRYNVILPGKITQNYVLCSSSKSTRSPATYCFKNDVSSYVLYVYRCKIVLVKHSKLRNIRCLSLKQSRLALNAKLLQQTGKLCRPDREPLSSHTACQACKGDLGFALRKDGITTRSRRCTFGLISNGTSWVPFFSHKLDPCLFAG